MPHEDVQFLVNYKTDALYTFPDRAGKGAYATLVGESEQVVGEIDVTPRSKLAVSVFYVNERADFSTLKRMSSNSINASGGNWTEKLS